MTNKHIEALEKIKEKINDVRDEVNPYINKDDCNYFTNIIDEISLDIECIIDQALIGLGEIADGQSVSEISEVEG